jgi:hypothetical protein
MPRSWAVADAMARVLALIPDLLFGSRVQSMLALAGHDVKLIADPARLETRDLPGAVLVVDLTGEFDGSTYVRGLSASGALVGACTLGFYSHVDVATRERAEQAGFDLIVPRSRMAREGADLVERLSPAD